MYLIGFPLLVVPAAVYAIIEFLMPGDTPAAFWSSVVTQLRLASGETWTLSAGDLLIAISILILFVELLKATRMTTRSIVDHLLSTLLFIAMLIAFLVVRQFATGTFFLLLVISFVDVVGGFSVSIRTAQRNVAIDTDSASRA